MPAEVAEVLTRVERIQAHFNDQYQLHDEDIEYLDKISTVFKIIHAEDERDLARGKIKQLYPDLSPAHIKNLIDDAMDVFGDFFEMNSDAMRIIQEKRHQRVYEAAMRAEDYPAAGRALKSIDQLYDLYNPKKTGRASTTKLPLVRRTSDPTALKKLTGDEEE